MTIATPYTNEIRYDIQWMYDTYGSDCSVDDLIGSLMLLRAYSLYFRDQGLLNKEAQFKKLAYELINVYNKNKDSVTDDSKESIGTVEEELV